MTLTVLEPTTIEGVDFEGEPTCNITQTGCTRPATVRVRKWCGCGELACAGHYRSFVEYIALGIMRGQIVCECALCHRETVAERVSDVIVAVIPL